MVEPVETVSPTKHGTMNVEPEKELQKAPKVRFPKFEGKWKRKTLGSIAYFSKGKGISKSDIVENGELECIRYGELYTTYGEVIINVKSRTNINANGLVLSEVNDVIIPASGETQIDIATASCVLKAGIALGGDLNIIKASLDGVFLSYYLNNSKKVEIARLSQGISVVHLYSNQLKTLRLNLPETDEQNKIAAFLTAVDKKIQQLTYKKELLEQYKRGLMQKIFSQEIRFKREDGSDYPDWEERQLSEFLIPTFREVPKPPEAYLAIGIRSHCRGTFQKPDSDPNAIAMDKLFVVKENDLIVNITFAWEGAIAMVRKEDDGGLVSHRFPTYTFNRNKVLNEFFKYVFVQKQFRYTLDLISPGGAGRNRVLSKNELLKIKWTMPLIEEVIIQLEQSQQFKKGLLQQMFV